jgi:hypothetical protein
MGGARRRARVTLALAAGLLLGVPACGEDEPPPVTAARTFARTVRAGDVDTLLTLVDARTAARVAQAAERASDQVGGRRNVEPQEMIQVVDVDPRFQVGEAELVQDDGLQAVVRLTGVDGTTTHSLELVNEEGSWRVRLPLPAGPMGQP